MRDFEDSTLWRISAFDRIRQETGSSGFARLDGPTLLPTTLLAELRRLDDERQGGDVLEVIAACLRHREPALLCMGHDALVWPVTVFPSEGVYHAPRDIREASASGLASLRLLTAEPPGVRPPGHWMNERVGNDLHYHPLPDLAWRLALHGPRRQLLGDIAGPAVYRMVAGAGDERLTAPGALGSALDRLREESVLLKELARWPGMSEERASRLLNALYLSGKLLVSRSRVVPREEAGAGRGLFGWRKTR